MTVKSDNVLFNFWFDFFGLDRAQNTVVYF